ncbi:MAG: hypothetical protein FWD39_03590 [Clostridiales bacterium]|nr:hypothetical protein [Clostridiales bacterium]
MKYEYKTSTGNIAIEVDEQFHELLTAMDNEEKNSNRKHSRRYPVSLENCEYEGEWFEDKHDAIGETESGIDMERALASLTEIQRICFTEVCLNGKTQRDVSAELGKSKFAVTQAIEGARKKLKKFF